MTFNLRRLSPHRRGINPLTALTDIHQGLTDNSPCLVCRNERSHKIGSLQVTSSRGHSANIKARKLIHSGAAIHIHYSLTSVEHDSLIETA